MNLEALAPWASDPRRSRGRRVAQPPSPPRNEHERDRDRIVHSTAFRRLIYKTQVFINHEGDLFRTRLTHSLEVAQIGRSVARALCLNEDLVEAVALAHDLGHTPFGHAGQDALASCMQSYGGFEHNLQSLRVVDLLEVRYPDFDGLNLSFETREGILKHCSRRNAECLLQDDPEGPAKRFIEGTQPSLEAQLVNLCDAVAYNAHDIDDGVRSGLLSLEQLLAVPLFERWQAAVLAEHPALNARSEKRLLFEILRRMLSEQVGALVAQTAAALAQHRPADAEAVHHLPALAGFGVELELQMTELKSFLFRSLYRHPQVQGMTARARTVVGDLFEAYLTDPTALPAEHADVAIANRDGPAAGGDEAARTVADYIAGMTDRFALREHHRLTGRRLFAE